jgi:hypothetical protein
VREEAVIAESNADENESSIDAPSIVSNETCIAEQIVHYHPCLIQQLDNHSTLENHNTNSDRFEDNDRFGMVLLCYNSLS